MCAADRRLVLGIGNTLNRDEGFGVHCVRALSERLGGERADIECLDGGTLGMQLLPLVESASHLLVLDAVDAGQPPATVLELSGDAIPLMSGIKLSQHQISFQEILGLAQVRGKLPPHLHLLGVQPADMSIGVDLSTEVAGVLPEVVERALRALRGWGISGTR